MSVSSNSKVWTNSNGRLCITLGVGHPYANSAGWQYVYRYKMMNYLGRRLHRDEHVHHLDRDYNNNELSNLRVVGSSDHGTIHSVVKDRYNYELNEWESSSRLQYDAC